MKRKLEYCRPSDGKWKVKRLKYTTLLLLLGIFQINANVDVLNNHDNPGVIGEVSKNTQQKQEVTGQVTETSGETMPGVTIIVKGSSKGVITDMDGRYSIDVDPSDELVFSFIGMASQTIPVAGKSTINVTLKSNVEDIGEVTIVAFGKQKKESVVSSITTVNPSELKIPSSNLTTALAGRMPGLISYQRSGEPGDDTAEFFIRGVTTFGYKKDPLYLIDGIELRKEDLANINPDDIATFSIMKDAVATALYGSRGANGVIYVTTKQGKEGPIRVSVRAESSVSKSIRDVDLADPVTYMEMHNEAIKTRNPAEGIALYSQEKIDKTRAGIDPYLYPTTDWHKELFKDYTVNNRINLSLSGGGNISNYFISARITEDNGVLEVDDRNDFNSNIKLRKYVIRSTINLNLTNTTKLKFAFNANLNDYTGPRQSGGELYNQVMRTNPVLFKPYYEKDEANQFTKHILFGNYVRNDKFLLNPYANLVSGYKESDETNLTTVIELDQDLRFITEGLKYNLKLNATKFSSYGISRSYNPFYYSLAQDVDTKDYRLNPLNPESGTEWLDYNETGKYLSRSYYFENSLTYARTFNDVHDVSGVVVFTMRDELRSNPGSFENSLPYRNIGTSGRVAYGYNAKYFGEFTFGYNGSERFSKKERFGFFPAMGLGWTISNEPFFEPLKSVVNNLKFKGTYGLAGNSAIGSPDDRFFYLSGINMNSGPQYTTGLDFSSTRPGVSVTKYANDKITWEIAKKMDVGFEMTLFNNFEIIADYFQEKRENILMDRISLASMGLESNIRANVGETESWGYDGSVAYSKSFTNGYWLQARGNFTYADNKIIKYEEPNYSDTPWKSQIGFPIQQPRGLIAERLFIDQNEVDNSPLQTFGEYGPGDIKYKDINGDGKITDLDVVPIGYPKNAKVQGGFGFSAGNNLFDISMFFQGSTQESFWLDVDKVSPFVNDQQLLKVWADDYWSEGNRNVFAKWPRLSENVNQNNARQSTWFMHDGSYLRLKSAEIGYKLPKRICNKMAMKSFRLYVSGTNLLTFSKFKLWDPEMGSNGLGYPIQQVFNLGLSVEM